MSRTSPLERYGPPIAVFFLVIALWELLVRAFNVQQFLLPAPTVITEAFSRTTTNIFNSAAYTIRSAVFGFGLGAAPASWSR